MCRVVSTKLELVLPVIRVSFRMRRVSSFYPFVRETY
jgi:hypothetical protein